MSIIIKVSSEDRRQLAEKYFTEGFNCCQSVVLAFEDLLPLSREELLALASGFGGGFGRLREVCGAVSGMTIIAGFLKPAADPSNTRERRDNYALVQQFANAFKEERGSIVCRELLGIRAGATPENPQPSERNAEYYHTRPCQANVGLAARIVAEYITESTYLYEKEFD